jgi:NAD(P)-dependent dehydrogenase (short-subunit alcohol dehydrogenase family)
VTDQRGRGDPDALLTIAGTVLVTGPAIPLTHALAREAGVRGGVVALASPGGMGRTDPDTIVSFPTALSSEGEVEGVFDAVLKRFSRFDVVITVSAPESLPEVHEVTLDRWHRSVTEPLRRHFWVTRRALEELLAEGTGGRLVTVLAPDAQSGERNEVVAEGLRSFTRSVAREYGRRGITCNLVLPAAYGGTASAASRKLVPAILQQALFLASPAASFVTGETLVVENPHLPVENAELG